MKTRKILLGLAGGGGIAGRLGNVFAWLGFALLAVSATTFPILGGGAIWETQIQEKPVWGPVESCADAGDNKQKLAKIFKQLEQKSESDPSQDSSNKDAYEKLDRLRISYSSFSGDNCDKTWDHARHYQFKEKSGWYYGTEYSLRSSRDRSNSELGYVSWFSETFPIPLLAFASWLVIILLNYLLWGAARILPWKRAVPEATES
jgi:hypothetical protein